MIFAKLRRAIASRDLITIRSITNKLPIADIADMLEQLTDPEIVLFFRLLKTETQSEIFSHLQPEYQEKLVGTFTNDQIDEIVGDLYVHEIADLIEEVPTELQSRILSSIQDKETREKVNKLLKFDESQIGSIMNVDYVQLREEQTIASALSKIRKARQDTKLTHRFFVVNTTNQLAGQILLEDIVFGSPRKKLKTLLQPVPSIYTNTSKETAAHDFAKYDLSSLPVLNANDEIVGVITADDMIDVVTDIATEDALKSVGISAPTTTYLKTPFWKLFRSRAVWLILLMVSATLSQIVLDAFQTIANSSLNETSSQVVSATLTSAIVAILPVISGAAGNAGSQSSTTIIRALAIGDVEIRDFRRVLRKEIGASSLMGIFLGIANFLRLLIYYAASSNFERKYIILSLAASLALFFVIMLAHVVGAMLPLLARKLKLDPAVMAAPLLTTFIDALSIIIFFGISIGIMISVIK